MANRINRGDHSHEAYGAMVALAGVRPISAMASQSVSASGAYAYTVLSKACKRVLVLVLGATNGDIRITVNETADANDWPLITDTYYSVEVQKDDTVNVFNTSGAPLTVYFLEIY